MKRLFLLCALLLGATTPVSATVVVYGSHPSNATQLNPADPAGTTSTSGLMMGLAGTITPLATGNVHIIISGTLFNAMAGDKGARVQMRTGSGAAPSNAAAPIGAPCGGFVEYTATAPAAKAPFSINCIVTGLTIGTPIWIDVTLAAVTGGTASVADVSISAQEL